MLAPSQQRFVSPSEPRSDTKKSLALWAAVGFVAGFSPIVIFFIFVTATKNDRPLQLPARQAMLASQQSLPSTTETAAKPAPPVAADQPPPASHAQPAHGIEPGHGSDAKPAEVQARQTKLPAVTPTPSVTRAPIAPLALDEAPKPVQAAHAATETNKAVAVTPPGMKKQPAEKTTRKNKREKMIKRDTRTKSAALTPTKRPAVSLPGHSAGIEQRPEDKVDAIIDIIVYQRWEQNTSGAAFPEARAIECTTNKSDVVCWTDVLTGKFNSSTYRYKVKLILDKFHADKQFIMTYRNLILKGGGKSADEETGSLGSLPEAIRPGWAPMIHRLPCQLASHAEIVCNPIGENRFVLKGTEVQTRSEK